MNVADLIVSLLKTEDLTAEIGGEGYLFWDGSDGEVNCVMIPPEHNSQIHGTISRMRDRFHEPEWHRDYQS